MGEDPDTVHVVGSPELDLHAKDSTVALEEVLSRYQINTDDYGIAVFHPVTSETDTMGRQAEAFFDVLTESQKYFVVILPNNDPGSESIFEIIRSLRTDRFRVLPSMRFSYFSQLLKSARAILGNSSVGVREAPFLGVPSLNFGSRQRNRGHAKSITHADLSSLINVEKFLEEEWGRRYEKSGDFGDGQAVARFLELIKGAEFWRAPLQKYFIDAK